MDLLMCQQSQTISAFTMVGAGLSTADIAINGIISATDAISISNLGNASGTIAITAMDTDESVYLECWCI